MKRRILASIGCVILLTALSGCESIGYYSQAIGGQLYILTHRQQISSLLASAATVPQLRSQLETVNALREFAQTQLQLPVQTQFSTYVDVKRPYVIWNVFAAEEFSINPLSWCYPVAGCVSYRGYFKEQAARDKADKLKAEGYEVYVGGVTAYSTLGWFSDPVLNTVINRDNQHLASLLFHELAHQVVYASGDTIFNESFATSVEQEGLRRWIKANYSGVESAALLNEINNELLRSDQFVALVQTAVVDLKAIYASEIAAVSKRSQKQRRLLMLREQYEAQKQLWNGYSAYDGWFAQELNNAQLSTVTTYNNLVPAFHGILQDCNGELSCLYQQVQQLASLPQAERLALLNEKMQ